MKKLDINQAIATFANLGVIAGIIFLAVEIQQNNQLLRAEAISSVLETRIVRQELNLTNPNLVEITSKNRRREPLSENEEMLVIAMINRSLMGWQKDFFLFQAGILDEEYLRSNFAVMKNAFGRDDTYSTSHHWTSTWSEFAAPAFRVFIEQCIVSDCDEVPR